MKQEQINRALQEQLTELTVMQDVHGCMLRALIDTHPDRQALGSAFDAIRERLLAQYVPAAVSESTLESLHAARRAFDEALHRRR